MTTITVNKVTVGTGEALVTTAGAVALGQPCAMKEFISNNRRDQNGRNYLTSAMYKDDTAVSVQFAVIANGPAEAGAAMQAFAGLFSGATAIGSYGNFLFKSIGSVTPYGNGGIVLFNANLIKLA